MTKLKDILNKLDGLKSVLGLGIVVLYYTVPNCPHYALDIGTAMTGIGIAAKLEKGIRLVSKILELTRKGLDVLQKLVDVIAPKSEIK